VTQKRTHRHLKWFFFVLKLTMRTDWQRVPVASKRFQVQKHSIFRVLDSFLHGLAVDVDPLEAGTVRMEYVPVRLNEHRQFERQWPNFRAPMKPREESH